MAVPTDEDFARNGAFEVAEVDVPGPDGAPEVTLLICRPTRTQAAAGCIYYIHGGGMVTGSHRDGGAMAEMLDYAEELNLVVVSVKYRLAPETRHPGPVEDCYAGLRWTAAHAHDLGFPPESLVIAGGSAGGGLAAATVLLARDLGRPRLRGQMLLAPMLDHRNNWPSITRLQGVGTWSRQANEFGWDSLLGPDQGNVSPYASPALADDLSGLPSTYIDVGGADAFRDEDVDYALRMSLDGGLVELHIWPGAYHGFEGIAPQSSLVRDAARTRSAWLQRTFEVPS